jgi:hypothetical protein
MSPVLKVRITEGLDAAIGEAAERNQISKAEWVRRALERTLGGEAVSGDQLARLEALRGSTADIEKALDDIDFDIE